MFGLTCGRCSKSRKQARRRPGGQKAVSAQARQCRISAWEQGRRGTEGEFDPGDSRPRQSKASGQMDGGRLARGSSMRAGGRKNQVKVGNQEARSSVPCTSGRSKTVAAICHDAIDGSQYSGVPQPEAGHRGIQVSIRTAAAMPPGQATKIRAKYVGARRIGPRSQTIGQGAQRLQHVFEHRPVPPPFMEHVEAACPS